MAIFKVEDQRGRVLTETDDWVDAQSRALVENWPRGGRLYVRGVHPTHDWDGKPGSQFPGRERRCRNCGTWDNGSYGSQSPCGYDWSHDSLVSALEREIAAREH